MRLTLFIVASSGVDSMVVTESNGDSALGLDSEEIWPAEMETEAGNTSSPSLEENVGTGAAVRGEDLGTMEERLVEDHLNEQPLEEKHNCERLSPQSQLDGADAEPAVPEIIFIAPLDGNLAELRTRVIKEVRKPGRSECIFVFQQYHN